MVTVPLTDSPLIQRLNTKIEHKQSHSVFIVTCFETTTSTRHTRLSDERQTPELHSPPSVRSYMHHIYADTNISNHWSSPPYSPQYAQRRPTGHLMTGGGVEKWRREACDTCVMCVRPMATGMPSVLMLMRRAAAFATMRPTFPIMSKLITSHAKSRSL